MALSGPPRGLGHGDTHTSLDAQTRPGATGAHLGLCGRPSTVRIAAGARTGHSDPAAIHDARRARYCAAGSGATMVAMSAPAWTVDPEDPRAPPQEVWEQMSDAERARLVESLPVDGPISDTEPPEGDPHWNETVRSRQTLERWFGRSGRRVYVSGNMNVFYPNERAFAPDVFAVLDVDPHPRNSWLVSAEGGRGLDLALEILVVGRRNKDLKENVERYARLGISEYFVFDRERRRLFGFRLPEPSATRYERLLPQEGRQVSRVLGLELFVENDRLRFSATDAPLPDTAELIARLGHLLGESEQRMLELEAALEEAQRRGEEEQHRREEEQHRREEEQRRREEEQHHREEEQRRREDAERELVALRAELARLRKQ